MPNDAPPQPALGTQEPGTGDLLHLVYASVATASFTGDELNAMVERARERNVRVGITAMLLYQEGTFLHALEGEKPAVRALFKRVEADRRHHQVQVLVAIPVAKRQFAGQAMGFHRFDDGDVEFDLDEDDEDGLPSSPHHLSWRACISLRLLARFRTRD